MLTHCCGGLPYQFVELFYTGRCESGRISNFGHRALSWLLDVTHVQACVLFFDYDFKVAPVNRLAEVGVTFVLNNLTIFSLTPGTFRTTDKSPFKHEPWSSEA